MHIKFNTVFCFLIYLINLLRFFSSYVVVSLSFLPVYQSLSCPESVFVFFFSSFHCISLFFSLSFTVFSVFFFASSISCHFRALSCHSLSCHSLSCHSLSCLIPLLSCPALVIVLNLVPLLSKYTVNCFRSWFIYMSRAHEANMIRSSWSIFLFFCVMYFFAAKRFSSILLQ